MCLSSVFMITGSSSFVRSESPTTIASLGRPTTLPVTPRSTRPDKSRSTDPMLVVTLIAAITGITILAACIIVVMLACLIYFRTKVQKHKLGELVELLLTTNMVECVFHYVYSLEQCMLPYTVCNHKLHTSSKNWDSSCVYISDYWYIQLFILTSCPL